MKLKFGIISPFSTNDNCMIATIFGKARQQEGCRQQNDGYRQLHVPSVNSETYHQNDQIIQLFSPGVSSLPKQIAYWGLRGCRGGVAVSKTTTSSSRSDRWTTAHIALDLGSLVWGFDESCTIVHCITSQPANLFSNVPY